MSPGQAKKMVLMGGKVNHFPNFPQPLKTPPAKVSPVSLEHLQNRNIVVQAWEDAGKPTLIR